MLYDEIKEQASFICETGLERFLYVDNCQLKEKLGYIEKDLEVASKKCHDLDVKNSKLIADCNITHDELDRVKEELATLKKFIKTICCDASIVTDFVLLNTIKLKDKESLESIKVIDDVTGSNLLDEAINIVAENSVKVVKEDNNG